MRSNTVNPLAGILALLSVFVGCKDAGTARSSQGVATGGSPGSAGAGGIGAAGSGMAGGAGHAAGGGAGSRSDASAVGGGGGGGAAGGDGGGAAGGGGDGAAGGGASGADGAGGRGAGGGADGPPGTTCPASPPQAGRAPCGVPRICSYLECGGVGEITATCGLGGTWSVASAPCAAFDCPMTSPQTRCNPGQLCIRQSSGVETAVCVSNPCGSAPVSCACAARLCGNNSNCIGVHATTVLCGSCQGDLCPP